MCDGPTDRHTILLICENAYEILYLILHCRVCCIVGALHRISYYISYSENTNDMSDNLRYLLHAMYVLLTLLQSTQKFFLPAGLYSTCQQTA